MTPGIKISAMVDMLWFNIMAMRFTTAGQVDSTFGANGRVDVDFYNLGLQDYGQQILIGHKGAVLMDG